MPQRFGKNILNQQLDVEAAITRGLANGDGYRVTAKAIQDRFTKGFNDALRVVRTESTRNRSEGMDAAFESMTKAGLPARKAWISAQDERTRTFDQGGFDHAILNGLLSDADGYFEINQGPVGKIRGPGESGIAGFDINCRCATGVHFDDEWPPMTEAEKWEAYNQWKRDNPRIDN